MQKRKTFKSRPRFNTGNFIYIEYQKKIGIGHVGEFSLILNPLYVIDSHEFVWQGFHKGTQVKVTVPKHLGSSGVRIEGNFPLEYDSERGDTSIQLRDEIDRILRQLK